MKRIFATVVSVTFLLSVICIRQSDAGGASASQAQRRSGIRFVSKIIKEANKKLRYTITARYPQAVGAARDPRLASLNQQLRDMMMKEVADFKKDFEAPEQPMSEIGSYYDAEYAVNLATNDLVSIGFGIDTYGEGAAHPNHGTFTFNYDLNAGKLLKLSDLFKPNSNYLSLISSYAIKNLKKQLGPDPDTDWIERGAGPSEENYKSWSLTRKGLEISFDPYQVASYAEGPHEVLIPYSALKSVIDPAGPLSRIVKIGSTAALTIEPKVLIYGKPEMDSKRVTLERLPTPPTIDSFGTGYGVGSGVGDGPGRGGNTGGGDRNVNGGVGQGDPNKIFTSKEVDVKARIIYKPEPQMTEAAKKNNTSGTVFLRAVLSATGQVVNIRVIRGLTDGLSEKAIIAAHQIKFVPAMKNRRPVSQYIQIEYNFNPY